MFVRIIFSLVLGLVVVVPQAAGSHPGLRCDSCQTYADFHARAIQNATPGFRYIFNLNDGVVRKFQLERDWGDVPLGNDKPAGTINAPPGGTWIAIEEAVENEVADFVAQLSEVYLRLGGTLHYRGDMLLDAVSSGPTAYLAGVLPTVSFLAGGIQSDPDSWPDAYHFAMMGNYRNMVMNEVRMGLLNDPDGSLLSRIAANGSVNLGQVTIGFNLQSQTSVEYEVRWPDGSKFRVTINRQTNKLEYVDGSLRDPRGATVPDSSHQYPSSSQGWRELVSQWEPSDVTAWLQAAAMRGINIVGGSGSRIVCGTVNGGPLQCYVFSN
jgi:hypothetical protein